MYESPEFFNEGLLRFEYPLYIAEDEELDYSWVDSSAALVERREASQRPWETWQRHAHGGTGDRLIL
jgi:hypothetical protein